MSIPQELDGPFPFSRTDLGSTQLVAGAKHTLEHFVLWRDSHRDAVADHVSAYTRQLEAIASRSGVHAAIGRHMFPRRRRDADRLRFERDINYFAMYNLCEVPDRATVTRIAAAFPGRPPGASKIIASLDTHRGPSGMMDSLLRYLPALSTVPETAWLAERLDQLFRSLPEIVIRAGGMGKAIRATVGVLAIGEYDVLDASDATRREHLAGIMPGAYALGAAYVIVDDTLHDLPGEYLSASDREHYHQLIARGLAKGTPVDPSDIPDHPLAEELHTIHERLLQSHPFEAYRHLYHAAEAMYLAQHRDANRTVEDVAETGIASMYPDILIKSGMSRVVANILGRRTLSEDFYGRCINTIVLGQFKDDLRDREEDLLAGRVTPFTVPFDQTGTNPLYDLFAYDAYVLREVFHGDPATADALTHFGAVKLATHLSARPDRAEELISGYGVPDGIARCLRTAAGLRHETVMALEPIETRIKDHCGASLRHRKPTLVDSRTFVADRLPYINSITRRHCPEPGATGLDRIVAYAMEAPGKRLRPALGLMLAEALDLDTTSIEPFVAASELFHTASLILDDLPAQDNATVRRGRPTAHTVFDEGSVQLAAVSMISSGFGLIAQLGGQYPAERVTEVIAYIGTVLGPHHLCRGQDLDLHMSRTESPVSGAEILEMYELKTSTTIEAALVPLMMLAERPPAEIESVRQYARNAGIVFQIRDDILDATSSIENLGKDTDHDVDKVNVVRVYGLAEALRIMLTHLDDAVACCAKLPFDTHLLEGMVTHFANRRR